MGLGLNSMKSGVEPTSWGDVAAPRQLSAMATASVSSSPSSMTIGPAASDAALKMPGAKASSRDNRIDFFRGIALIGIAINHTVPPPALYEKYGHYQFGHFFSFAFADVFVYLSGLVCAMAYTRVLDREGWWGGQRKAIHRCLQIYLANTIAFLIVAAMMLGLSAIVRQPKLVALNFETAKLAWSSTWKNLLLMNPGFMHFNILRFYIVMLMLMPA